MSLWHSLLVVAVVGTLAYLAGRPPPDRWYVLGISVAVAGWLVMTVLAVGAIGQDETGWFADATQVVYTVLAAAGVGGLAVRFRNRSVNEVWSAFIIAALLGAPLMLMVWHGWRSR